MATGTGTVSTDRELTQEQIVAMAKANRAFRKESKAAEVANGAISNEKAPFWTERRIKAAVIFSGATLVALVGLAAIGVGLAFVLPGAGAALVAIAGLTATLTPPLYCLILTGVCLAMVLPLISPICASLVLSEER